MSNGCRNIIIGFGSPHGDDQIGWLVADRLAADARLPCEAVVRKAVIPLDLLDHLDGVDCLHVCDAVYDESSPGAILRSEWCANSDVSTRAEFFNEFRRLRSGGSHDFGLMEVLDLVSKLHRLPQRIVIWSIAADRFAAGDATTKHIENALPQVTETILNELIHSQPSLPVENSRR